MPDPSPPTPCLLAARAVTFSYSPSHAPVLRELTAEFPAGAITAIVGPNGAGKTTLLRVLLGLVRPLSGEASWTEPARVQHVADMPAGARARRLVYIPQRLSPAFGFLVRELVEMGRHAAGAGPDRAAIASAMERARVGELASRPFDELSVGQQQRVGLARALAQLDAINAPAALLADEPAAAMDPLQATHALSALTDVARAGRAVVVVLHDLAQVLAFCERTLLLDAAGRVAAHGPTRDVLTPAALESLFGLPFDAAATGGKTTTLVPRTQARLAS
ncbi:MAG: ABC transporter ATP-binding protein [Phycisphaerae bacterium]|nr:ABC transporter ATP-binding protein [Phycisphaerae bacterium]